MNFTKIINFRPGKVAYAYNPSTLGGQKEHAAQEFKTSLGNMVKPFLYKNYKKISWARWCALVVPATGEAEVGESLEPWRSRLQ